jgi:ABC-type lipoprotein export system ATPase subunit
MMQILLRNVVPDHIEQTQSGNSRIWNQEIAIRKGEHVHIVAPSGSGKTSLMHFMYGIRKDYSGSIYYDSTEIKKLDTESFAVFRQKQLSIIFQDLRLFAENTVQQNIEIKRMLSPFHKEDAIEQMASRLGIANKLQQKAGTCSYGEQQRVAIIRALMQPFDFLLLDEPFSHLDEDNRQKAMELIYEECEKRGAAMVFADLKASDFLANEKIIYL